MPSCRFHSSSDLDLCEKNMRSWFNMQEKVYSFPAYTWCKNSWFSPDWLQKFTLHLEPNMRNISSAGDLQIILNGKTTSCYLNSFATKAHALMMSFWWSRQVIHLSGHPQYPCKSKIWVYFNCLRFRPTNLVALSRKCVSGSWAGTRAVA